MNQIEFSFDEMAAFAALIQNLNAQGVPYSLAKDAHAIRVTISRGF